MIKLHANYTRQPELARFLTRDELISESNRLENLSAIYSDRDYVVSNEFMEQARVLDKVLLNHMVQDDYCKGQTKMDL